MTVHKANSDLCGEDCRQTLTDLLGESDVRAKVLHVGVDKAPTKVDDFVVLRCRHGELWHVEFAS